MPGRHQCSPPRRLNHTTVMLRVVLVVCLAVCVLSTPWPHHAIGHGDCTSCATVTCVDVSRYCPGHLVKGGPCGCCLVCSKIVGDLTDPHHAHCVNDGDDHSGHDHTHDTHDEFCDALGHRD